LLKRVEQVDLAEDIVIGEAKNGEPTLSIGKISLHSGYNPSQEAERLAVKGLESVNVDSVVIVFGLGMGFLANAVAEKLSSPIFVIEPRLDVLKAALENGNLSVLAGSRVVSGESAKATVEKIESSAIGKLDWSAVEIISHPPLMKLHRKYFEEFQRLVRLKQKQKNIGRLGILIPTPMYGGSYPIAGYCANAFRKLGHRVEVLDNSIYNQAHEQISEVTRNKQHQISLTGLLTTLMAESITAKAIDKAVDLVFLVAQSPMTAAVAKELKKRHIPIAFWFVEDWRVMTYWKDWAPLYDYFFTIQKGEIFNRLERIGVRHAHYLPLAVDPEAHKPLSLTPEEIAEYGSDISHVGAGYYNRRRLFSRLNDFNFKLWGNDWQDAPALQSVIQREGARLSTEDSNKVFHVAKISINLHSSLFHEGVNPDGDYLNPRTFELAGAGAFQLCDERSLLAELFEPEREIVTFSNETELKEKIAYYLDHPEERQAIAKRARQRALTEHTYEKRMAEVLEYIYSYEDQPAGRNHPDHVDNLLENSGDDDELRELLQRFKNCGVVTLDEITDDIRKRQGKLNHAETTFLLMYEFRRWAREKGAF